MTRITMLAVLLLAGCGDGLFEPPLWDKAPTKYQCSTEEIERVHHESKWCSDNSGYLNTYCYGAAIMRICKQIKETK